MPRSQRGMGVMCKPLTTNDERLVAPGPSRHAAGTEGMRAGHSRRGGRWLAPLKTMKGQLERKLRLSGAHAALAARHGCDVQAAHRE